MRKDSFPRTSSQSEASNGDSFFQSETRRPCTSLEESSQLMDGKHTPQNVAAYSFLLGLAAGVGAMSYFLSLRWGLLGIYISTLGCFHVLEYISTATINPQLLELDSFVLNHSTAYHLAIVSGLVEFIVETWYFQCEKHLNGISLIGLVCVVLGQFLRSSAMLTAKSNFTHQIATYKKEGHTLVTHGIYRYFRHPSYFGFYIWAVGTQVLLQNPICILLFIIQLQVFFKGRISVEEKKLVEFFGEKYTEYKKATPTWIPFVP